MSRRTSILAVALLAATTLPAHAETLIIGADTSGSAAIVHDEIFARRAGAILAEKINGLRYKDTVKLRAFGEYKTQKNPLAFDAVLSLRYRPDKVAQAVGRFVAGIPASVQSAAMVQEENTNILGFLDNMGADTRCSEEKTTFILISDGLEYSQLRDSYAIATSGQGDLPALPYTDFTGCHLEIWGFGVGLGPAEVQNLRGAWQRWAKEEGFASIALKNDW